MRGNWNLACRIPILKVERRFVFLDGLGEQLAWYSTFAWAVECKTDTPEAAFRDVGWSALNTMVSTGIWR
jgi:hypothetical protein